MEKYSESVKFYNINLYKQYSLTKEMERFSIENRFQNVSFIQFKTTAERLESALKEVRPSIQSKLLLTTNGLDYRGYGSLTILTPETEATFARREGLQLQYLNQELWARSFKTQFQVIDNSTNEPYCIWLSNEVREPKKLFFYGQCLDEKSQEVFEGFRKVGLSQRVGDGYHKTSPFAVEYALSHLGK